VMSIMSGHIALPWLDPATDYRGPMPATLSRKIQVDLMREELGFEGAIISDAICMAGYSTNIPRSEYASANIASGSDMVLFARPERDFPFLMSAVEDGRLSEERVNDAVRRVVDLKMKLGLFEGRSCEVTDEEICLHQEWADEMGRRSISLVRNEENRIPVSLHEGDKALTVTCGFPGGVRGAVQELDTVDKELEKRGFAVKHVFNPSSEWLNENAGDYEAVFMNIHVPPRYGSVRMHGELGSIFWNSFWLDHPCVVFTSFGDPNKLYEMPYAPNYINAYSNTPSSQRAAVKVWLGEEEALGRSPLKCGEYFDIEV